jgi:hypothetical protein
MILPILLLGLLVLAGCQTNGPKISITPAEKDMGQVPQQIIETDYTVKNEGSSTLTISKVSTSCDCTKASIDRTEIPAGESANLHVRMDPALLNLYGKIQRDIIVETNDPKTPVAKAIFKVNIQKP